MVLYLIVLCISINEVEITCMKGTSSEELPTIEMIGILPFRLNRPIYNFENIRTLKTFLPLYTISHIYNTLFKI